jgi:hypothetical protein
MGDECPVVSNWIAAHPCPRGCLPRPRSSTEITPAVSDFDWALRLRAVLADLLSHTSSPGNGSWPSSTWALGSIGSKIPMGECPIGRQPPLSHPMWFSAVAALVRSVVDLRTWCPRLALSPQNPLPRVDHSTPESPA